MSNKTSFNFKNVEDIGIQAGELVMKLPRPLQIWDLDALRDMFIQHEFLGFDTSSVKKIARHKDTQKVIVVLQESYYTVHTFMF